MTFGIGIMESTQFALQNQFFKMCECLFTYDDYDDMINKQFRLVNTYQGKSMHFCEANVFY